MNAFLTTKATKYDTLLRDLDYFRRQWIVEAIFATAEAREKGNSTGAILNEVPTEDLAHALYRVVMQIFQTTDDFRAREKAFAMLLDKYHSAVWNAS